jgi:hypothetical protein
MKAIDIQDHFRLVSSVVSGNPFPDTSAIYKGFGIGVSRNNFE